MNITEHFELNALIWVRSLPEDELGPSGRITDDVDNLCRQHSFTFKEVIVGNKSDIASTLRKLVNNVKDGLRPIIHFDSHGSKEHGLLLAPSGEYFSWPELAEALRTINVETSNNLICVFSVCYGCGSVYAIELMKPTLSNIVIAPSREVNVGFLEDKTIEFYRHVLESGDATKAFNSILAEKMELFSSQMAFLKAFREYVITQCKGKGKKARREHLTTEILNQNNITQPNSKQLKNIRNQLKRGLEPNQETMDQFAKTFLIGRELQMTFDDLMKTINEIK